MIRFPAVRVLLATLTLTLAIPLGGTALGGVETVAAASANPPTCRITDITTKYHAYTDYTKTVLDWNFRLPANYAPHDLVPVSRAGLSGGGSVRSILISDLAAMTRAARAAGAPLAVASAYRSYATQVSTFAYWVRADGYAAAIRGSARPGHSEHQLGTAIDFKSYGGGAPWGYADWAKTKAGAWMMNNAWKYGFILSYPQGKQASVCYSYEPWHYRYYGKAIAKEIHNSGLAPRVWLWRNGSSQ